MYKKHMTEHEMDYISLHREEITRISRGMSTTKEVIEWLRKTYPRDCWSCPGKAKQSARNIICTYDREKRLRDSK